MNPADLIRAFIEAHADTSTTAGRLEKAELLKALDELEAGPEEDDFEEEEA